MTPDMEEPPVVNTEGSQFSKLSTASIGTKPLTRADLSDDEFTLWTALTQMVVRTAIDAGKDLSQDDKTTIKTAVFAKIAEARQHAPLSRAMAAVLKQLTSLDQEINYPDLHTRIFNHAVDTETDKLRVREAARRRQAAEQQTGPGPTEPLRLDEMLLELDEDPEYRIAGLHPTGGRTGIFAMRKIGKSTLMGNVTRCLVDDEPLFGRYPVEPVGRVLIIDNELDPRTLKRWLRDQQIRNTHRVDVLTLRGRTGTFNIIDPEIRAHWARLCAGADIVIFDCLRPILDALGLSEDKDAGRFLVSFDAFLAEAGIGEAIVVHHMGHAGERARGDSRIQDWPDAIWKLVSEDPEDPSSPRFFSAYGRDVNVPEFRLDYDQPSRRLSVGGGSRKDGKIDGKMAAVLEFIERSPGTSKTGIKAVLPGDDKVTARAIDKAVELGLVEERDRQGQGGGKAYYPTPVTPVNPGLPRF